MMSSPEFKRSLKGHFLAKPAEVRTSSNAGCLSEPLSSDVSVGLGKLGRVLERLVHLMSKTGAVEKTDQAEVGRTRAHVDLGAVPLMDDPEVRPDRKRTRLNSSH